MHRDIKPENILLFDSDFDCIKLCDFGWATVAADENRLTFCGTADYLAPEIARKEEYSSEVDIWACGILLYEMLTGKAPFSGADPNSTISKIVKFELNDHLEFDEVSKGAKYLIGKILVGNPAKRVNYEDIMKHKWMNIQ